MDALVHRHGELSAQLSEGGAMDPKMIAKLSRELNALEKVVTAIREYRGVSREIADVRAVVKESEGVDPELAKMAKGELEGLEASLVELEAKLTRMLLPKDEADVRDAILELRAGTGGDEAALFAADLMTMYASYAASKGWQWSPMSVASTDHGGVKEATIAVSGDGAFGKLKYESGVHRVQRVPATEAAGRVHTSTASVAVLPEAEEVDVDIRTQDLRIDTYRAGGAGGQHVNVTDSAVRITHIPTGVVVSCQDERSQHQNRAKAMRVLRARIFEAERERQEALRSADRKAQIGRAERSERIRTYNFSQNRVTDHRVNISKFDMAAMMRGDCLDEFFEALEEAHQEEQLQALQDAGATAAPSKPK